MIKTTEEIIAYEVMRKKEWIPVEEVQKAIDEIHVPGMTPVKTLLMIQKELNERLGIDCSDEPKTKILVCIECQDKLTKLEGCEHYGIWLCQECYSKTFKPKGDDGK